MEDKGTALVAWHKVARPKAQGGLGVVDLTLHNKCMLMKHMYKFMNCQDLPWVQLILNT